MEIKVIEKTDKSMKFQLIGAGHTFCNHLKHELYSDKDVDASAYRVDHPLIGIPTMIIHLVKKGDVKKHLLEAAKRIENQNREFIKSFEE